MWADTTRLRKKLSAPAMYGQAAMSEFTDDLSLPLDPR
jgi:hypothetical protein